MKKLPALELQKLKKIAKGKDYDAAVAVLDLQLSDAIDKLVKATSDHRYVQGEIHALQGLRDSILLQQ